MVDLQTVVNATVACYWNAPARSVLAERPYKKELSYAGQGSNFEHVQLHPRNATPAHTETSSVCLDRLAE